MKTFVRFSLYSLTVLALVFSATGAAAAPEEHVLRSGNTFTVYPTGVDDTANLQHAFDLALAAGPGSTVQLAPGNFRIGHIEVPDFKGYFKGAGQDLTVIDSLPGLDCQSLVNNNKEPALLYFIRGYPRISDLTFHITPKGPCAPYHMDIHGDGWLDSNIFPLVVSTSPLDIHTDCDVNRIEQVSASIERITIWGEDGDQPNGPDSPLWPNIYEGVYLGGTFPLMNGWENCPYQQKFAQGQFRVVQSTFRNALLGLALEAMYNSQVVTGGSPKDGNTFDYTIYGLFQCDTYASNSEYSHNRLDHISANGFTLCSGGMSAVPFTQAGSNVVYRQNDITAEGWANAFVLGDVDNLASTSSPPHVVIQNNRLKLLPDFVWGIFIVGGLEDPLILNNQFEGNSDFAIVAGYDGLSRGGLIKGNNLNGYTLYNGSPYKIWLGADTESYVVVGEPAETVLDEGTNNLIVGNGRHGHQQLGQAIQEAMKHKMEILKSLPRGFRSPFH